MTHHRELRESAYWLLALLAGLLLVRILPAPDAARGLASYLPLHTIMEMLSIAVAAALRTVTQGYSWSVPQLNLSGTFTAPTIPRFSNPPGPPAIYEYDDRTIRLTAPVTTAPGGVSILEYQVRRRDNWKPGAGWTIMGCDANRQCWFTPEKPLTRFDFESRARTSAGWSDWSSSYSTIDSMGMGPQLRYNGVFKDTNAFVKYEGTWVPVIPWVKHAGVWEKVVR